MNNTELKRSVRTARDLFRGKTSTQIDVELGVVYVRATDEDIWYEASITFENHGRPTGCYAGPSKDVVKCVAKYGLGGVLTLADSDKPFTAPRGGSVSTAGVERSFLLSVVHAACADETRFYMLGVRVRGRDGILEALATDGHRGAISVVGREHPFAPVTVPTRLVRALGDYCPGRVTIEHGPGFVRLRVERDGIEETLTARPVDGDFPPLERVFDNHVTSASARTNRARLADAVQRVGAATGGFVRVSIDESRPAVHAYDRGPDHDVVYRVPALEPVGCATVTVDADYLVDALESVGDEWVEVQITRDRKERELRDAIARCEELGRHDRIPRLRADLEVQVGRPASAIVLRTPTWRAIVMPRGA